MRLFRMVKGHRLKDRARRLQRLPAPADPRPARTSVHRNPQPSLLLSLLNDHIDAGYAESAAAGRNNPRGARIWLIGGTLVMGLILGTAAAQQLSQGPSAAAAQAEMVDQVRTIQHEGDELAARRDALSAQADGVRTRLLAGDSAGASVLADLETLEADAASTAVRGPGVVVEVGEPKGDGDLSDSQQPRGGERGQVVLDRDLQSVVNALWASGAEAVGIDGVRIGPNVAIRQAGGAILVDNQPVTSPYSISAIGPGDAMHKDFIVSDAYLRMQSLQQLYGAEISVQSSTEVRLPRARTPELRYARGDEEGPP